MIFGVRAVIEAIQAGKEIDKILVKKDIQSDLVQRAFCSFERYADTCSACSGRAYQPYYPEKSSRSDRFHFFRDLSENGGSCSVSCLKQGKNPFFVMLDGVTDVRNFGAIARTCECAAVDAVIIPVRGQCVGQC